MRVTANTFPESLVNQLSLLSIRQNRLQNQAATGQRIQYPEDDPTATRRVMDLQTEGKAIGQYRRNIASLQELTTTSYGVLKSIKKISDRAGEIATLADGLKSRDELMTYATEVTQLIQQAANLMNTKHRGDFLFAGTLNSTTPYSVTTNVGGQVTAVAYNGNDAVASTEISEDTTLSAQIVGANTSGVGAQGLITDSRVGADFFNHLIALQNDLLAGDTTAISTTDRAQLSADEDNFIFHIGTIGAVQARLETADTLATTRSGSLEALVSQEADADLAQTLVKLSETQNAYRAALQSGSTVLNVSLLDYLR